MTVAPTSTTDRLAADRAALVRAFTAWTADTSIADDLAQETLLAAWTSTRQPERADAWRPWLFGIARNILLRWRRDMARHGRRTAPAPENERHLLAAAADDDIDALLRQEDIVDLLDSALGRLPMDTRQALLLKYLDDLPQAEIAARLGIHEKALEGRLHRGKRAIHRHLLTERADTAVSLGLIAEPDTWVETSIWCTTCGRQRLVGRWWEDGFVRLDCPSCVDWALLERSHVFSAGIVEPGQPRPSFARAIERITASFSEIETAGRDMRVPCSRCGQALRPVEERPPSDVVVLPGPTLRFQCLACGHVEGYRWIPGNGTSRDDERAWRAAHPRTRMERPKVIRFQERDAIASTWYPLDSHDPLTVIHDLETWRVLHVDVAPRDR